MKRGWISLSFSVLAASALGVASAETPLPAPIRRGLDLIHEGKIAEGEEELVAYVTSHAESRPALVYAGIGCWWLHISEFGNPKAAADAIGYFNRALATGAVTESSDGEALFEAGLSHMLLSHLLGSQGSVLKAAMEAKRGKALLEVAQKKDPDDKDIGFGLGAYDYYADRLPKIMKGIRALLRLPGGNASRGIQELEGAAHDGRLFSCEASLVLADIYASSMEHKYVQGIDLVSALVVRYPDNPFFRAGRADLLSDVGEHRKALEDIAYARQRVPREQVTLWTSLQVMEAQVRDKAYETEAAVKILDPLLASPSPDLPKDQLHRVRFDFGEMLERLGEMDRARAVYTALHKESLDARLEKKVDRKLGSPLQSAGDGYRASQDAITLLRAGSPVAAEARIRDLLAARDHDPVLTFLLAESMTEQGKARQAKPVYDEAYTLAGAQYPWVGGWCLVRLGDLELSDGHRDEAIKRYEQALAIEHWSSDPVVSYRLGLAASVPKPEVGTAVSAPTAPSHAAAETTVPASSRQ